MTDDRAPITPQPVDTPLSPVPSTVEVGSHDAEKALALWDQRMREDGYAGLLDATIEE